MSSKRKLIDWNVLCWCLWSLMVGIPQGLAVRDHIRTHRFEKAPDISFVYFYGMGKLFNEYPPGQVYDYTLQKRVCTQIHSCPQNGYAPIPYSPVIGILFEPFAKLSFSNAVLLWFAVTFVLYAGGLFALARAFLPREPLKQSLVLCFGLSYWPFLHFFTTGQISAIGFAAIVLVLLTEYCGRSLFAGIALSICLYKPTLLLLFLPMLLVTRRYRTLYGFALGAAAQIALVTAIEGLAIWPAYLQMLVGFGSAAATRTQHNFAIYSTSYVDLVSFFNILPMGRFWLGRISLLACLGCALFILFRSWLKLRHVRPEERLLLWAATVIATLVINTYVGIWDAIFAVPGIVVGAVLLKRLADKRTYRRFALFWTLALVCCFFTTSVAEKFGFQLVTPLFALLAFLPLNFLSGAPVAEALAEYHLLSAPSVAVGERVTV